MRLRPNAQCPATPSLATSQTGPQGVWRPSACRGVRDCARFSARFDPKGFFENFARPPKFRSEILCDCAQMRSDRRRLALRRAKQVHNVSGDHLHAVACGIASVFRRVSIRNFRKFCTAAKISVRNDRRNLVRLSPNAQCPATPGLSSGLATSQTGPQGVWRPSACRGDVRDCAFVGAFRSEIFENYFALTENRLKWPQLWVTI